MITLDLEYVEKIREQLAKLPDGKTDTERRLLSTIDYLLEGSYKALWQLERLNANNEIAADNERSDQKWRS